MSGVEGRRGEEADLHHIGVYLELEALVVVGVEGLVLSGGLLLAQQLPALVEVDLHVGV